MAQRTIRVYTDYKSPYAYLAKDPVYDLERETAVRVEWLPYTLDIPAFLGSARVDAEGNVVEEARNDHQWRRVKYSYMDCRREAEAFGVFGVPSFLVDGDLYWGREHLPRIRELLRAANGIGASVLP